jgi:hypothetical protein
MSTTKTERTVLTEVLQRWKGEAPEKRKWVGEEVKWQDEVEYEAVDGDDGRVMVAEGDVGMFTFDLLTFSWVLIHPLVCLSVRGEGAGVPRVGWGIFDYFTRKVYEVHEEACKDGGYVKYIPWTDVNVDTTGAVTTIKWKEQQAWLVRDATNIDYRYERTRFKLNTTSWNWEMTWKSLSDDGDSEASNKSDNSEIIKIQTKLTEVQAELEAVQKNKAELEAELAQQLADIEALRMELQSAKAEL